MVDAALDTDSPWRTSTSWVGACRALAQTRHRIGRTFCTAVPRRHAPASKVGAVPGCARLTIRAATDPRDDAIAAAASAHGIDLPGPVVVSDVVLLDGDLDADRPSTSRGVPRRPAAADRRPGKSRRATPPDEIRLHPGSPMPPPPPRHAGRRRRPVTAAATGRRVEFPPDGTTPAPHVCSPGPRQPVIERWAPAHDAGLPSRQPEPAPARRRSRSAPSTPMASAALDASGLALDLGGAARPSRPLRRPGRDPTDVELETLAQTWSEHCSHKTFRAAITVDDGTTSRALLGQLRDATEAIAARSCARRSSATPGSCRSPRARRWRSRPRPTTTPRPSSRSAGRTPASAESSATCSVPATGRSRSPTSSASARPISGRRAARRGAAPPAHPRGRRRRRRRLRQQDRAADGRRRGARRPWVHANPLVFCGASAPPPTSRRRPARSPATSSSPSAADRP